MGRDPSALPGRPSEPGLHDLVHGPALIHEAAALTAAVTIGARFRYLMETAPVAAFVKDADGHLLHANPYLLATMGKRLGSDWRGKTAADFWPPDLATRIRADDEAVLREGTFQAFTRVLPLEDGPHAFLVMKFPLANDDGRVNLGGVGVDVSGKFDAETERGRITAAMQQVTESVVMTDLEGRITYVNPAFELVTGYGRAEVLGQNSRIFKSGLHPRSFYEAMWATLTSGLPWVSDELVNRRKDGSFFTEKAVISPIRDASGEVTGYVAVTRDVTLERALAARSDQLLRERALIAETIRGLRASDKLEATAQAICRQVASLTGIAVARCRSATWLWADRIRLWRVSPTSSAGDSSAGLPRDPGSSHGRTAGGTPTTSW